MQEGDEDSESTPDPHYRGRGPPPSLSKQGEFPTRGVLALLVLQDLGFHTPNPSPWLGGGKRRTQDEKKIWADGVATAPDSWLMREPWPRSWGW